MGELVSCVLDETVRLDKGVSVVNLERYIKDGGLIYELLDSVRGILVLKGLLLLIGIGTFSKLVDGVLEVAVVVDRGDGISVVVVVEVIVEPSDLEDFIENIGIRNFGELVKGPSVEDGVFSSDFFEVLSVVEVVVGRVGN